MGEYNKSAINNSLAKDSERIEAIYDYVGAVYGNSPTAKYDGNLTDAERKAVVDKFGELKFTPEADLEAEGKPTSNQQSIYLYLEKARGDFLKQFSANHNAKGWCTLSKISDGRTERDTFTFNQFHVQDSKIGQPVRADFIGGPHDSCGLEFGLYYMVGGTELAVAADPTRWVFFIESFEGTPEVAGEIELFKRISKALEIPIYNPTVFNTTGRTVVEAAAKKLSKPEGLYYGSILSYAFLSNVENPSGSPRFRIPLAEWSLVLNQICQVMQQRYGIDPAAAKEHFFSYIFGPDHSRTSERDKFAQLYNQMDSLSPGILRRNNELALELAEVCNELNLEKVKENLAKHPDRKNAFYQMGSLHEGLVDAVYSSSTTPKNKPVR